MKKKSVIICIVSGIVLLPIIAVASFGLASGTAVSENESYKTEKRSYSRNEYVGKFTSTFKSLNTITYPTDENKYNLEEEYKEAVASFSKKIYQNLPKKENISFSPLGLYSNLSIVSLAASDSKTVDEFDQLLGATKEIRTRNYKNLYRNDFYISDDATLQMYNGYFQNYRYTQNEAFINSLKDYYCQAFSLDFGNNNDVSNILKWIDQRVKSNSFLTKDDLEIDKDTMNYYFSTVYFNAHWYSEYDKSKSYYDNFINGDLTNKVQFMKHKYVGKVEEHEKYVVVQDRYDGGFNVKYFVPKNIEDSIYDLVDDSVADKVIENAEIELSVPKFKTSELIDFGPVLKSAGLVTPFLKTSKALNNAFTDLSEDDSAYLGFVKQKNEVIFEEDGTTIRSVTFSQTKNATACPQIDKDCYIIKLNQPFIYVVYDLNGLPLYIGNVDNPKN